MCQALYARMHIELDDELVAQIYELSGPRGRSAFVRSAIERAVRQELRWTDIEAAAGAHRNQDHEWDTDPGLGYNSSAVAQGRALPGWEVIATSNMPTIGTPGR
jgi:Arc/MetJ family transcription regulator